MRAIMNALRSLMLVLTAPFWLPTRLFEWLRASPPEQEALAPAPEAVAAEKALRAISEASAVRQAAQALLRGDVPTMAQLGALMSETKAWLLAIGTDRQALQAIVDASTLRVEGHLRGGVPLPGVPPLVEPGPLPVPSAAACRIAAVRERRAAREPKAADLRVDA